MNVNFGLALKTLRSRAGLTQEQLAHLLETDATNVSRMERNLQAPAFRMLLRLPDALHTPLSELFREAEQNGQSVPDLQDPHARYDEADADIERALQYLSPAQRRQLAAFLASLATDH